MDLLRKHLLREGHLNKPELMELIKCTTEIMSKLLLRSNPFDVNIFILLTSSTFLLIGKEPNVHKMKEPVIIVGDIHGQFYDLIHMFEKVVDSRLSIFHHDKKRDADDKTPTE
jgi:hypothetical protein